jgi:hypothetical protein
MALLSILQDHALLLIVGSIVWFLVCRYILFRRPITAEDARVPIFVFALFGLLLLVLAN